jgi:GGDEF domain-containing protein/ActR/RegA family two-component response regulator
MSGAPDEHGEGALRVLAASREDATLGILGRTFPPAGLLFFAATDLAEAIATAAAETCDIAFVDVELDGGAGLALVHHLSAAVPGIVVYAIAPQSNLELGAQAVALGAAGFVSSPVSGDALLHAVGEVRARRAAARQKQKLEADLLAAKRRNALMDRVVQLAQGGAQTEVARAVLEALVEVADAHGGALYTALDPPRGECTRLAAMGTAQDLPASSPGEDLARLVGERGSRMVPLGVAERLYALVVLDDPHPARAQDLAAIASLAATVLAFVEAGEARARDGREASRGSHDPRSRVYSFAYLQDIAGREIDKARRHERRLAVAAILLDPESSPKTRADLEQVVLSVVRDTDVLARFDPHEFYLLLPETGALGAHSCRRRLLIRAEGDRRSRTPASDRRGPVSARPGRGVPVSIGVGAYPHDGTSLDRLLRAAKQRAQDASRSAVHALALAPMGLGEIVDVLLGRPMMGAGFGSPYPLDLVAPAMLSLVSAACREAKRGGTTSVLVTARSGMGMASAARQLFANDGKDPSVHVADVRTAPRCENAEAIVISAEHGSWVCCGRRDDDRFRGVHAADPLLADLIAQRLAQASGVRWP